MAMTLLMATIALQAGQTTAPKPLLPDVLLARAEQSVEAEKSLNDGSLDPSRLLFLTTKTPIVACYGRLALEMRASRAKVMSALDLIQHGDSTEWTKERTEEVRAMMLDSPFRETVRAHSQEGLPMTLQFSRTTTIAVARPDGYYSLMPVGREPLGKALDLVSLPPRVVDLPPVSSASQTLVSPSPRSVCCIVPRRTKGEDQTPYMKAGLAALAAQQSENTLLLSRSLPASTSSELTSDERSQAIAYFANSYKDLGFPSREAAISGLQNASLIKYASLEADVDTSANGHTSEVGWTITNLTNH